MRFLRSRDHRRAEEAVIIDLRERLAPYGDDDLYTFLVADRPKRLPTLAEQQAVVDLVVADELVEEVVIPAETPLTGQA